MLTLYIISIVALGLAADQNRVVSKYAGYRPDVGITPFLFDLSGFIGNLGALGMIVGGFFIGEWWWPFSALVSAWVVIAICRSIPPSIGWLLSILGAVVGSACATMVFVNA
ncbi:MAG: hypothetical protein V7708_02790 [Oceanicoccus sp.]